MAEDGSRPMKDLVAERVRIEVNYLLRGWSAAALEARKERAEAEHVWALLAADNPPLTDALGGELLWLRFHDHDTLTFNHGDPRYSVYLFFFFFFFVCFCVCFCVPLSFECWGGTGGRPASIWHAIVHCSTFAAARPFGPRLANLLLAQPVAIDGTPNNS